METIFENPILHHGISYFSKQAPGKLAMNTVITISVSTGRREPICSGNPLKKKGTQLPRVMFTRVNSDRPPSLKKRNLVLIISTQSRFCLRKVENREFLIGRGLKSHQDTHHLVLTSRLQHSFQVVSQTMFERSNEGNSWLPEAASPFFGQLLTVRKALQMLK